MSVTRRCFVASLWLLLGACASPETPAKTGRFDEPIAVLADKLESDYIIPDVGARYASMLRANLSQGRYAEVQEPEQLATLLTQDLRAVSLDLHLRVELEGQDGNGSPNGTPAPPVEDGQWLSEGVAYVRLNGFPGTPEAVQKLDRFLMDHADAKALILDARAHRGGGTREMNTLLAYLFSEETPLVYMDLADSFVQKRGPPPDERPFLREIEGPPGVFRREHVAVPHASERRLLTTQVFYLTSLRTASAAEHLALALKRTRRATLVGERTAGANHFGGFERLGSGLVAFVPVGRTVDPDTGEDWEGSGVAPDVAVAPERAVEEALGRVR